MASSLKRSIAESSREEEASKGETNEESVSKEEIVNDESPPKQPKLEEKNNGLIISLGIRKGERPEMQDRHSIQRQLNCGIENIERSLLICLFDGHAGFKASEYCNQNFHKVFNEFCQKYSGNSQEQLEKNIKKIFIETYKKVDDSFLIEARKAPVLKDGSTGTTILFLKNTIYSANVGDSQAFLCRRKTETADITALQLTADHSPINFEERSRIHKAGGFVGDGRLLGILEVSRAFGDGQLKAHGLISIPSVKKLTLTDSDLFVVCGSDGLWKTFKPLEALEIVYKKFQESRTQDMEETFNSIANHLAETAIMRKCGDNVSIIIVAIVDNLLKT